MTELHAAQPAKPDLAFAAYAWAPSDRERLYAAIEQRFQAMMRAGLLEEVRKLYERGDLHADLPAIRCVGYRQLWEHLRGRDDLDSAIQRAIFATRHLARRQLIWLRSEPDIQWLDALDSAAGAHMDQAITQLQ